MKQRTDDAAQAYAMLQKLNGQEPEQPDQGDQSEQQENEAIGKLESLLQQAISIIGQLKSVQAHESGAAVKPRQFTDMSGAMPGAQA